MRRRTYRALTTLLADAYTLYLKTKNFHWHMSGRTSATITAAGRAGRPDLCHHRSIAERARKLGGTTLRSVGHIARLQRLRDNDAEYVTPLDMLAELREDNKQLTGYMRETHGLCDEHGDVASASSRDLDRRSGAAHLVSVRGRPEGRVLAAQAHEV